MSRRERAAWGAVFVILFLLVNLGFCVMQYREYRQKLELVYDAAAADDAVSWAVGILKKGIPKKEEGQIPKRFQELGYNGAYRDALRRVFVQNCMLSFAGSSVLFLVFALFACRLVRRNQSVRKQERDMLRGQLALLRKGCYGKAEKLSDLDELGIASLAEQMTLFREEAAREKEETKALVTDISHQLRTPLAALSASVDILERGGLTDAEREEFVGRCSSQLVRLKELTSSLLAISRMETGMIQIRPVPAPVFDTILQAVNRIYPKADEKHMEIVLEESGEAEQTLLMQDVRWLSEAFINILENAVKYSEPFSAVTIRGERRQTFFRIEFADSGIGIPRKERNRIFRRFYRVEDERVQRENGSGVGLYLARKIIEQHGGTIRVTDAPGGRGSVFIVQLPYRQGGERQGEPKGTGGRYYENTAQYYGGKCGKTARHYREAADGVCGEAVERIQD